MFDFARFVSAVGEGTSAALHMEGGLSFKVKNIDHKRLLDYLDRGKIPIWDGVAVSVYPFSALLFVKSMIILETEEMYL